MRELDLTVRAFTVLKELNITTVEQLVSAELPKVGTVLRLGLLVPRLVYTERVDQELKETIKSLKNDNTKIHLSNLHR